MTKLHLTVSDPQEHEEAKKTYVSYCVEVQVRGGEDESDKTKTFEDETCDGWTDAWDGGSWGNTSVRRRYSDFQWLYQRLQLERPGSVVPIIPHRHGVWDRTSRILESVKERGASLMHKEKLNDDGEAENMSNVEDLTSTRLVQERLNYLQSFLRQVVVHPELSDAPSLVTFLRADDLRFKSAREGDDTTMPADPGASTSSFYRPSDETSSDRVESDARATVEAESGSGGRKNRIIYFFLKTFVSLSVRGKRVELEKTDDEAVFEQMEKYMLDLEVHVKAMSQQASILNRTVMGNATGMHELSQSFDGLRQNRKIVTEEDSNAIVMFEKVRDTAGSVSALGSEQAKIESSKFQEPIREMERIMQAVKVALQQRKEKQLEYTARLMQLNHRRAVDKIDGKSKKEEKALQVESELHELEQASAVARDELDEVSKRILREMERVKKRVDCFVLLTMADYARLQLDYTRRLHEEWADVLPSLEKQEPIPPQAVVPPQAAFARLPSMDDVTRGSGEEGKAENIEKEEEDKGDESIKEGVEDVEEVGDRGGAGVEDESRKEGEESKQVEDQVGEDYVMNYDEFQGAKDGEGGDNAEST